MLVLLCKLGTGIACCIVSLTLIWHGWIFRLTARRFSTTAIVALICVRLGVFIFIYGFLNFSVPSDVPGAYYPDGLAALDFKVVYRSIPTTYAPLFPYICAAALALWNSPKCIVLIAILFEAVAFPCWLVLSRGQIAEWNRRVATVLYVFSPLLISTVSVAGQNHVWLALFIVGSLWFASRSRSALSGVIMAAGFVTTKFLAGIFFPAPLLLSRSKTTFLLAACVVILGVYVPLWLMDVDFLYPLHFQRTAGQESAANIPYLLSALKVPMTSPAYVIIGGILFLALLAAVVRANGRTVIPESVYWAYIPVLLFTLALLFSKKAYTTYWAAVFFPLAIVVVNYSKKMAVLLFFQVWATVATLEPSLFFRWFGGHDLLSSIRQINTLPHGLPKFWCFLLCQLVLISFNLHMVVIGARMLRDIQTGAKPDLYVSKDYMCNSQ